jgi:hypothetical protein
MVVRTCGALEKMEQFAQTLFVVLMNGTNGTENRTSLARPINAATAPTDALERLALAALGGALIGVSRRNGRTSAVARSPVSRSLELQ